MKTIKFPFLFLLFPMVLFSQIQGEDEVYLNGDRIEAKFNGGGIDKFSEFINKEFDYSKVTKSGKMVGAFTIDVDGNVKNIKITEFFDIESATEFIRVLKKCPKWEPAKRGGKPISIEIKYPMVFKDRQTANTKETVSQKDDATETNNKSTQKQSGGLKKFYEFVNQNYKTPEVDGLKGKVVVKFTINEDGSLSDFEVVKDLGYGTAAELIRVLKLTSKKWTPAEKDGKPIKSTYTFPLNIQSLD